MKKLQYVQSFELGGETYAYLRYKRQPRVKLPGTVGSREFTTAYKAALSAAKAADVQRPERVPAVKKSATGTLRANVERYLRSAMFNKLAPHTQLLRSRTLLRWCDGDKRHGVPSYGEDMLLALTPDAVKKMLYARENKTGAQRHFLSALRHLLKDCKKAGTVPNDFDPTKESRIEGAENPHANPAWTAVEMDKYRAHWATGTRQRRALEVLYASGAACVDAIQLSNDNIEVDEETGVRLIRYKRQKTKRNPKAVPAYRLFTAELEAELPKISPPKLQWILNSEGQPYSHERYFSRQFAAWARAAGVDKTAHGVRKTAATDAAMAGVHINVLMRMFGWLTMEEAARYTRLFDGKRGVAALGKRAVNE